jgi:23S rRNA pseudouridine2604 synthase
MCEYLGYEVVTLKRLRIMHIELGDLEIGKWRDLTAEEVQGLKDAVVESDNSSFVDQQEKGTEGKRRRGRKT